MSFVSVSTLLLCFLHFFLFPGKPWLRADLEQNVCAVVYLDCLTVLAMDIVTSFSGTSYQRIQKLEVSRRSQRPKQWLNKFWTSRLCHQPGSVKLCDSSFQEKLYRGSEFYFIFVLVYILLFLFVTIGIFNLIMAPRLQMVLSRLPEQTSLPRRMIQHEGCLKSEQSSWQTRIRFTKENE